MPQIKATRPLAVLGVLGLAFALALPLRTFAAEEPGGPRLLLPPAAPLPADGRYLADDQLKFMIDHDGERTRLRFIGGDEVFYLLSEPAPLGGRVLKYDTGEVALQVAGWGGVTLYTAEEKSGMPAELADGNIDDFDLKPVAGKDLKAFAARLSQTMLTAFDFAVGFTTEWDDLATADAEKDRALAVDAMRNAARAVALISESPKRAVIAERFHLVRVVEAAQPGLKLQEGTLTISYAPQLGSSGRPSSLAIAKVLQAGFNPAAKT